MQVFRFPAVNPVAGNCQLLRNIKRSDNVTEQYTINLPSTIAFYGRHLKKLLLTLSRLLWKTFSIPSLLSVSDKNTCIRETTATI
jgi:hypothetical protein